MARRLAKRRRRKPPLTRGRLTIALSHSNDPLADVDKHSGWMRRLRQLAIDHINDLGGEGLISHAERVLVKRCAMLTLQLEMIELKWMASEDGEATEIEGYQRCVNTLRRTLEALGLQRRAKEITPTLDEYLARQPTDSADGHAAEPMQ